MRVRSLIILLVLVGAIAYVVFFQWAWLMNVKESLRLTMAGYHYATSPEEAMDQFAKAIKERDYNAAALYVTADYAAYLRKAQPAAYTLASDVDRLVNLAKAKGINNDRSLYVLRCLDPFPGDFTRPSRIKLTKMEPQKKQDDNGEYYVGQFTADYSIPSVQKSDLDQLDLKMFRNALMPPIPTPRLGFVYPAFQYRVKIVGEGIGDNRIWKLAIPVHDLTKENIRHMMDNYKKYDNALTHMINDARVAGGYDSPGQFEREVIRVMGKQN